MTVGCDQVLSTENPLDEIVIVKNGCSSAFICSSGRDLFIYNINGPENSLENWKNARLCQCFNLDSFVVKILPYEKKLFIVLKDGLVLRLESVDSCQDDEYDMFEIEDSPETINSWKLEEICSLDASVLSASISKLGVCILAKVDDKLQLFVVKRKLVATYTFNKSYSSFGCCCVLNISNLSFDFMNLWFPHVERWEEFLLIGLSDGSLYCFPLTLPLKSYNIYNSVHSIVSLSWFQNRQSERFDALVIVLDSGAVIRLTPVGEEISFPFLPFLNSAVSLKNCIISKREFETRYLLLSDLSNKSKFFSVSEVVSGCNCNDSNKVILVCDKQCKVFLIHEDKLEFLKESVKIKKDLCGSLPKINDLQQLIAKSLQLSKVNKTIKIHDEYLRAKSLVSRSDVLKQHFALSLKLVQILEDKHTIRIKLTFDLPGIVFSKDFWKLKVILTTVNRSSYFIKDLAHNISAERTFIQLITIPISFNLLYDIECKLVSYVDSKNVELNLPLDVVELDASFFLLPPSLRELCSCDQDSTRSLWVNNNTRYSLGVNIPEILSNYQELVGNLLRNSKALWRTSEWKKMLQNHCIACVLFGTDVDFIINENRIAIESWNLKICQAVRLAFYKILNRDKLVSWRETLAHSLMDWQQAENVIELSLTPEGHINDLYNILRNSDI